MHARSGRLAAVAGNAKRPSAIRARNRAGPKLTFLPSRKGSTIGATVHVREHEKDWGSALADAGRDGAKTRSVGRGAHLPQRRSSDEPGPSGHDREGTGRSRISLEEVGVV